MRVIIAGGREVEPKRAWELLEMAIRSCPFSVHLETVISGGASGIDMAGVNWAVLRGIPYEQYLADWEVFGRGAGPIRNEEMADNADALIAIWDGKSRGTKNMIETATRKGLKVFIYRY